MTVFLCGFMGCGKSTIGKSLAKTSGVSFIDMDTYIEKTENMSIPEIFKKHGEAYFRKLETHAVKNLSDAKAVIACGGGAMLNPINSQIARESGKVIFLDVPFGICYSRIKDDSNRPIVVNNSKSQLEELYNYRYPIYKKHSDFTINANSSPKNAVKAILELLT